jgi:hypothetical protein
MNELSINLTTAVILFYDESKKFLNQDQYQAIKSAYGNPNVQKLEIDGCLYSKSSISKILTLQEYYEQYPDENVYYGQPPKDDSYFNQSVDQVKKETLDKLREKWGTKR